MEDESGVNRYTRRDFGRVTGSAHDYSDPRNTPPLYGAPPAQAVDLAQLRTQVADLLRGEFDLEVADPEDHRHNDGRGEADRIAGMIVALLGTGKAAGNG